MDSFISVVEALHFACCRRVLSLHSTAAGPPSSARHSLLITNSLFASHSSLSGHLSHLVLPITRLTTSRLQIPKLHTEFLEFLSCHTIFVINVLCLRHTSSWYLSHTSVTLPTEEILSCHFVSPREEQQKNNIIATKLH